MRYILLISFLMALLLIAGSTQFAVDRTEFVYVTQFGKSIATYDGETEAGLHFKLPWPIQSVQRLDHRLQVFDLAGAELLTHDPDGKTIDKTLTISAFVCWRIADKDGVDRFIKSVGTPEQAEVLLGRQISSRLGAEISKMKLEDLISEVSDKDGKERMDALSRRLCNEGNPDEDNAAGRQSLKQSALQTYGIEVVDIRLRRFNYPTQVRDAIFDRIRSERNKKVADYQSLGDQRAKEILSKAESEARIILADAHATEQRLKGEAEAKADQIRDQAHRKDVAFYTFLKKLAAYQRILADNQTVLLLSAHRDLFDLLFKPPSPEAGPSTPGTGSAPITSKKPATNGGN
jgi:membrane protease subunit HflC